MNSSISSSDEKVIGARLGRDPAVSKLWLVVAVVLACLLALEAVTRARFFRASKDLSRFSTYPARALALTRAQGTRVAFVGNSLTERGVDASELGRTLGVTADLFVADGSHVNTWYWIIEREFWKRDLKPDLIVMNFYEAGLEDGKRLEIGRLAQFFSDRHDWLTLFKNDVTELEPRVDLVLSSFWATYAVRDRIKDRTLGLIPGFKSYTERANEINFNHEKKQARLPGVVSTRKALQRLCERAKAKQTPLLFVAFPSLPARDEAGGPAYDVPHETIDIIERTGQRYLDLRVVPGLEPRHYSDDVHLTREGKAIYTRYLAEHMQPVLARDAQH